MTDLITCPKCGNIDVNAHDEDVGVTLTCINCGHAFRP